MMGDTINKFLTKATRFACTNAGDSINDANFFRATADATILSLCNEENWIIEILGMDTVQTGTTDEYNFMDNVLTNKTNRSIKETASSFAAMQFRKGILVGLFEMLHASKTYRLFCQSSGIPMHSTIPSKLWAQIGKAKKGFSNATILVTDSYPQWKVDTLLWMQEQYGGDGGFPLEFVKKLKERCESLPDKKLIKFTMNFVSFTKKEVDDVGPMAKGD